MNFLTRLSVIFFVLVSQLSFAQFSPKQLFDNGLEAFYGAKFQDGAKYFKDYIKTTQSDFQGYKYLGLCHQAMKDFPGSIEDFTNEISVSPKNPDGYLNRGNSNYFNRNFTAAMKDFDDAIRLNPKELEAFFGKSRVFIQKREYDQALKQCNSAEGIDPENARVFVNKSFVHMLMGDTTNLFNDIATAMYYDSNIVFTDYRRDLLFVKVENYKLALSSANVLVNQHPDSYLNFFMRGFIYFLMNSFENAKADFDRAYALNTDKNEKYLNVTYQILRSIKRNSNK